MNEVRISFDQNFFTNFRIGPPGFLIDQSTKTMHVRAKVIILFVRAINEFEESCLIGQQGDWMQYACLLHCSYLLRSNNPELDKVWLVFRQFIEKYRSFIEETLIINAGADWAEQNSLDVLNASRHVPLEPLKSIQPKLSSSPSQVSFGETSPNKNNNTDHDKLLDMNIFCMLLPKVISDEEAAAIDKSTELFSQLIEGYQRACVIHTLLHLRRAKAAPEKAVVTWEAVLNTLEYFMEDDNSFLEWSVKLHEIFSLSPEEVLLDLQRIKCFFNNLYHGIHRKSKRAQLKTAAREIPLKDRYDVVQLGAPLFADYQEIADRIKIIQAIARISHRATIVNAAKALLNQLRSEGVESYLHQYNLLKADPRCTNPPRLPTWLSMPDSAERIAKIIEYLYAKQQDLTILKYPPHQISFLKALFMLPATRDGASHASILRLFTLPRDDVSAPIILGQLEHIPPDQRIRKIVFVSKLRHVERAVDKALILGIIATAPPSILLHAADGAAHLIDTNTPPLEQANIIKKLIGIPPDILKEIHKKSVSLAHRDNAGEQIQKLWRLAMSPTSPGKPKETISEASKPPIVAVPPQQKSPPLSKKEEIINQLDALLTKGLELNVEAALTDKLHTIRISGAKGEKFNILRTLLRTPRYTAGITVNIENNKGGSHTLVLSSKELGPLHSLMTNGNFHKELQTVRKDRPKPEESIASDCTPLLPPQEICRDKWTESLKELSFGANVLCEKEAFIIDFKGCYKGLGNYELNIRPLKASLKKKYPQIVNATQLEGQLISRLMKTPSLKRITHEEQNHQFGFRVMEAVPDDKACLKIYEDIVLHFTAETPSMPPQPTTEKINEKVTMVNPQPLPISKTNTARDQLIDVIHEITEDQAHNYAWLSQKTGTDKDILFWNTKQQRTITLNGKIVIVKPFIEWLCKEIKGLNFLPKFSEPSYRYHAGLRIYPRFVDVPLSQEEKNELQQRFISWLKASEQNDPNLPEEDSVLEDLRCLLGEESIVQPKRRALQVPETPNWNTLRKKLNPNDPILPHADALIAFQESPVKMNNLKQLRAWQVHFVRFVHFLRERYRERCSGDEHFLTDLRTVIRHNTFDVDWEKNEAILADIVQYGFHFLCFGFDNNLGNFKSIIGLFNQRHIQTLDSIQDKNSPGELEAKLANRMLTEMLALQDFLTQEQSKTTVIMTAAIIGKLAKLNHGKKQSPFERECVRIRRELGHTLPDAQKYLDWESDQYQQIQKFGVYLSESIRRNET